MIPKLYISRTPDGNGFPLLSYTSKYHYGLNLLAAIGAPVKINPNERLVVPIGFAVGVPAGYCGLIVSESAIAEKHGIVVSDAPHVLNPADREPVFVLIQNVSSAPYVLHRGEVIAEMLVVPALQIGWQEVKGLENGAQTSEKDMIVDEGITPVKQPEKNPFKSLRRPKLSIRNRYKNPDDDEN